MKVYRLYQAILIIASILIFQIAIVNPVVALQPPANSDISPAFQVTPTVTALTPTADEVLTTDPILLQIIIVLGIFVVLVIFLGVWISRRQVDPQ